VLIAGKAIHHLPPCLAFGFFFRHVEASFDPTITELEQMPYPPLDRSAAPSR
jgi:hypothetical protein